MMEVNVNSIFEYFSIMFNVTTLIEVLMYLLAGIVGMIIRVFVGIQKRILHEHKRANDNTKMLSFKYSLGIIVISTTLLVIFGDLIQKRFASMRVVFGISVAINVFLPQYISRLTNKKFLAKLIGVFAPKIGKVLEEDDYDSEKEEKHEERPTKST